MKLILLKDVKNVGKKNDLVEVSDGYGRNFLLKNKFAIVTNSQDLSRIQKINQDKLKQEQDYKLEMESIYQQINNIDLEMKVNTSQEGHLFGSIKEQDIAKLINQSYNVNIDKNSIIIDKPIKSIGSYVIKAKLLSNLLANINLNVSSEK